MLFVLFCSSLPCLAQKPQDNQPRPIDPAEGHRLATQLVAECLVQKPDITYSNALLKIRDRDGNEKTVSVQTRFLITPTNWTAIYEVPGQRLQILHNGSQPTQYHLERGSSPAPDSNPTNSTPKILSPSDIFTPFAGSDFWPADLGLEFLHWPAQRVLKREMYSSRFCDVLDSTNPKPVPNGYTRVRSWIISEKPHAPVRAEAYDSAGKRIKVFDVKGIERVEGEYRVESIEMRDLRRGSRTIMEFTGNK